MQHSTEIKWVSETKFDAHQNGKVFRIDGEGDESLSTGFRPKALILSSLAGCTGIDIVDLLKKMRVEFSDFSIKVTGDLTEEHPKTYHTVRLQYHFYGSNLDEKKLERAVNISVEKYCGVMEMFRQFAQIEINIQYHHQ